MFLHVSVVRKMKNESFEHCLGGEKLSHCIWTYFAKLTFFKNSCKRPLEKFFPDIYGHSEFL